MPLLSIIVPIYNVEPYLREGLSSILNQDIGDIEIICIDDASTDTSLDILKEYATKDPRIIIVECKNNGGPSKTRNIGINYATGKYITFFDPDDKVCTNMYYTMIQSMESNGCDIAMCGYKTFPSNKKVIPQFPANLPLSPTEFINKSQRVHSSNDLCFTWRFVFRRDLINNNKLCFIDKLRIGEDTVFNLNALMLSKKIIHIPEALYNYRVNNLQSIMHKPYNPYMEECLQLQIEEKKKLIKEYNIDKYTPFTKDMAEDIAKRYTLMLFNNLRNNPNETNKIGGIKRILNMPMIKDAMKIVGYRNIYSSWKEYVFYLTMRFKLSRIVYKLYFK